MTAGRYLMPQMPHRGTELVPLEKLAGLGADGAIRLVAPLTPTQNAWGLRHWSQRRKYRDVCLTLLTVQVMYVLGGRWEPPWAPLALLDVVRCSLGPVAADTGNVIGGMKELIDTLLLPRPRRPGIGLLVDDAPAHLRWGNVEDRPRGHWGDLDGPGTWLWIRRITPDEPLPSSWRRGHGWAQP